MAFNANFSGEQSYLVLARKAYRPEDLGAIISFRSLKYTATDGMFRSLVGHSCIWKARAGKGREVSVLVRCGGRAG